MDSFTMLTEREENNEILALHGCGKYVLSQSFENWFVPTWHSLVIWRKRMSCPKIFSLPQKNKRLLSQWMLYFCLDISKNTILSVVIVRENSVSSWTTLLRFIKALTNTASTSFSHVPTQDISLTSLPSSSTESS